MPDQPTCGRGRETTWRAASPHRRPGGVSRATHIQITINHVCHVQPHVYLSSHKRAVHPKYSRAFGHGQWFSPPTVFVIPTLNPSLTVILSRSSEQSEEAAKNLNTLRACSVKGKDLAVGPLQTPGRGETFTPHAPTLSKGRSWFDKLTTNGLRLTPFIFIACYRRPPAVTVVA